MSVSQNSAGHMSIFWGQSLDSYDEAIKTAVAEAAKTIPSGSTMEWFEVIEFRGGIKTVDGVPGVAQFQVAIRIGYS